ncbi:MAG: ABC transporter ATP-binding protein [Gemmatimonadota bacterium]
MTSPLLEVRDLRVEFDTAAGPARAVDGVSFAIAAGETVALVGESGCGKSVTAAALLGLVDPPGTVRAGRITFEGRDCTTLDERAWTPIRGRRIGLVFQAPSSALTPVRSVGAHLVEAVRAHERVSVAEAERRALDALAMMGIDEPAMRLRQYPPELSGGLRQRVLLAMALLPGPALLVADEPTTALDVTVQADVLDRLREAQAGRGMALLLITHDLGVVATIARRVLVMYAGQLVEAAPVERLFAEPAHPYTAGLLAARPSAAPAGERLAAIPGTVPPATAWPTGCRFAARCPLAWERCRQEAPALLEVAPGHAARCHLVSEPARRGGGPA